MILLNGGDCLASLLLGWEFFGIPEHHVPFAQVVLQVIVRAVKGCSAAAVCGCEVQATIQEARQPLRQVLGRVPCDDVRQCSMLCGAVAEPCHGCIEVCRLVQLRKVAL